jgi:6-phosphogluconolactonase (cycloisomerase 2 family)
MKNLLIRLTALSASLILAACQVPLPLTNVGPGSGTVRLSVNQGRTVVADPGSVDHYDITLTQQGFPTLTQTLTPAAGTVSLTQVPLGTWEVAVTGRTAAPNNLPVASGTGTLTLDTPGQTVSQTITVLLAQTAGGTGHFRLPVRFNASTGIDSVQASLRPTSSATWTDLGAFPVTTDGGICFATLTSSTALASGTYQLLVTFRRGGASGALAGTFGEAVNVWDNVTSDRWIDSDGTLEASRTFADGEFSASNAQLASLVVKSAGAAVNLTPGFVPDTLAYTMAAGSVATVTAIGSIDGQTIEVQSGGGAWTALTSGIESGEIGLAAGTGAIAVRVTAPDRSTKTYTLTQSLVPNQASLTLVPGFSGPFTLTVGPGSPSVTWSSGNTAVATVDSSGKVSAVGTGTTTITATASGATATCAVTVVGSPAVGAVGPAGGLIISDQGANSSTFRWTEAAPADTATSVRWTPANVTVAATSNTPGAGDGFTANIVAAAGTANGTSYAAYLVKNLTLGGCSDWYLPCTGELSAIGTSGVAAKTGMTNTYWSSEWASASAAWGYSYASNLSMNQGQGALSNVRAVRKVPTLAAPANVRAYAGNGSIRVVWDPVPAATGYTVYWKAGSTVAAGESSATVVTSATAPKDLPGLTNGTTYAVTVMATNAAVVAGNPSAAVTATPTATLPTLTAMTPADGQITFGWSAYSGATSYSILVGDTWPTLAGTTTGTSTILTGLGNSARPLVCLVATTSSGSFVGPYYSMMSDPGAPANLLTNPDMTGFTGGNPPVGTGWTFTSGGSGWASGIWANLGGAWITSYVVESVTQTVDLTTKGFTAAQLATPGTKVGFGFWDGQAYPGATYYATLELLASDGTVLDTVNRGTASSRIACDNPFVPQMLTYTNTTGKAIAKARVTFGGKDGVNWAGCYGAAIMQPVLTASLPPTAAVDNGTVLLTWVQPTQPTGATGYKIYRSTASGTLGTLIATIGSGTTLTYRDTGLTNGTTYYYTVNPVFAQGDANVGVQVAATPVHEAFYIANWAAATLDIATMSTSAAASPWVEGRVASGVTVGAGPSVMAIDAGNKFLYESNSNGNTYAGVAGFAVNPSNGGFSSLVVDTDITVKMEGLGIASPNGATGAQFLYATAPDLNKVYSWTISNSAGTLSNEATTATLANPRALNITPNGKFLYTSNLSSSSLSAYSIDASTGALTIFANYTGNGLGGPFKGTIDPTGTSFYVANNSSNTVSHYTINPATGVLTFVANYSPPSGGTGTTAVVLDSTGTHAYVTASSGNVLELFNRNTATGALTWVATYSCSGYPNGVAVDLSGSYLVVPCSSTNNYDVFSINRLDGTLTKQATKTAGSSPNEIKFIKLN